MDLSLDGKIAMITGGSRGLGLQIATALAREGCRDSICGRDGRRVQERVADLAAQGYQARGTGARINIDGGQSRSLF
jgi:NAD(P)-dependent dehydrogenase (short-subunit alcohol dehydrogenase family)